MRINLLNLDDALIKLPEFRHRALILGARELWAKDFGGLIRLWSTDEELASFSNFLEPFYNFDKSLETTISFIGSGDFHHITPVVVKNLLRSFHSEITIFHFDNHPDWVNFSPGSHCGSWVNDALKLPKVARVITLGPCSDDLSFPELKGGNLSLLRSDRYSIFPFYHSPTVVLKNYGYGNSFFQKKWRIFWRTLKNKDLSQFMNNLLDSDSAKSVYISIDKDVLNVNETISNWDQGKMSLSQLKICLRKIAEKKRIFGIDVLGDFSKPVFNGNWITRFKKKFEIKMDHQKIMYDNSQIEKINSKTNLELLDFFLENCRGIESCIHPNEL
ncbi:MAG: arginase [Candidatus Riflebacteria bacterium]|nr:arginase [Candidatus Riflebacteria bacterium]